MELMTLHCIPVIQIKVKVKVKLCLCFNWALCHEGVLGEWMYSSTRSLTLALDGGEWSASRPSRFSPRERAPSTHLIGGWVGPRFVMDAVVRRKIPSPCQDSNPRTLIIQPIAECYTDWAIMALPVIHIEAENCIWTWEVSTAPFQCRTKVWNINTESLGQVSIGSCEIHDIISWYHDMSGSTSLTFSVHKWCIYDSLDRQPT
jgi:hypothetical protein